MSSATSTACESKHEDTYIARVAHTKTLRKGRKHSTHCAMVQLQYEYKHGYYMYITRAGHARTLYKRYKHSTHCAMVQSQYEYNHGQNRYIARADHAKPLCNGYKQYKDKRG